MKKGKLEGIKNNILFGWLWDSSAPTNKVEFGIEVNGRLCGMFVANKWRPDLEKAKIGDGGHAFEIDCADIPLIEGDNELHVICDGEKVPAIRSLKYQKPVESHASVFANKKDNVTNLFFRGRIEGFKQTELRGWLWQQDSLRPVQFKLYIDEKYISTFVADIYRKDLDEAGIGNGHHSFSVNIDPAWMTQRSLIRVDALLEIEVRSLTLRIDAKTLDSIIDWRNKSSRLNAGIASAADFVLSFEKNFNSLTQKQISQIIEIFGSRLIPQKIKQLQKNANKTELIDFFDIMSSLNIFNKVEYQLTYGRALLYSNQLEKAISVLTDASSKAPNNAAVHFYASVAYGRNHNFEKALSYGRVALNIEPMNSQYIQEYVHYIRKSALQKSATAVEKSRLYKEAIELLQQLVSLRPDRSSEYQLLIANSYLQLGKLDDALLNIDFCLATAPNNIKAMLLKSDILVRKNEIPKALAVAREILEIDPHQQTPIYLLRTLKSFEKSDKNIGRSSKILYVRQAKDKFEVQRRSASGADPLPSILDTWEGLLAFISKSDEEWIYLLPSDNTYHPNFDLIRDHFDGLLMNSWAGRLQNNAEKRLTLWRKDLLHNLLLSGIISEERPLIADLESIESMVATCYTQDSGHPVCYYQAASDLISQKKYMPVILMSRHGVVKFGGGEHFLESMAIYYSSLGFDPIIVGAKGHIDRDEGVLNGRKYAFISGDSNSIRTYILHTKPAFVHVLSSLGYETVQALQFLSIPIIYGVHFWRDCLGRAQGPDEFFENVDSLPIPRPEFSYIIENVSCVYANSQFTQSVLEEAFSFRAPIVYSLPADNMATDSMDRDSSTVSDHTHLKDYVLLVNAKPEKGFDLLLDIAQELPDIAFLAIASQSEHELAQAKIDDLGLSNLHLVRKAKSMGALYERSKIVVVPSYQFVETFSRVCIEAHRFGKPVLGSSIGNVPYLLRQSGIILSNNAGEWVAEIRKLFADEAYYVHHCSAAIANSERYPVSLQRNSIRGILSNLETPLLVGVGSGIGNMLHVGPMLRNIVSKIGRKIDLVISEDHSNSLFLLKNDDIVNEVFALNQSVLKKRYHTCFITHSFGSARPPFQAQNVIFSRDWRGFEPGGDMHETIFNLESARTLLGVDYEAADALEHYIGNYKKRDTVKNIQTIGFHGGSKGGFWQSKRWPKFDLLAMRLKARGFKVISFGTTDEYIAGTENLTGGTIQEMVERLNCVDYFVSNDSGLMNIANALGIPVLCLFAPTNVVTRRPLGLSNEIIAVNKDCAPCEATSEGKKVFQSGECRCIEEITVDYVEQKLVDHVHRLTSR